MEDAALAETSNLYQGETLAEDMTEDPGLQSRSVAITLHGSMSEIPRRFCYR